MSLILRCTQYCAQERTFYVTLYSGSCFVYVIMYFRGRFECKIVDKSVHQKQQVATYHVQRNVDKIALQIYHFDTDRKNTLSHWLLNNIFVYLFLHKDSSPVSCFSSHYI